MRNLWELMYDLGDIEWLNEDEDEEYIEFVPDFRLEEDVDDGES